MSRTSPDRLRHDGGQPTSTEKSRSPLLDVVACGGTDTAQVVMAAQAIQADVRSVTPIETWLDPSSRGAGDRAAEPADCVILVGAADRMVSQNWIARAVEAAPDSIVAAAIVDASLDHAMSVVGQGARGLLVLPNSVERLTVHLREFVGAAVARSPHRREVARHRRAAATLTPAEKEVLEGMLSGMPNKQIAQRLSIGLRTVELRRSKIMKKMKAKSLAQLISFICLAQYDFA